MIDSRYVEVLDVLWHGFCQVFSLSRSDNSSDLESYMNEDVLLRVLEFSAA